MTSIAVTKYIMDEWVMPAIVWRASDQINTVLAVVIN